MVRTQGKDKHTVRQERNEFANLIAIKHNNATHKGVPSMQVQYKAGRQAVNQSCSQIHWANHRPVNWQLIHCLNLSPLLFTYCMACKFNLHYAFWCESVLVLAYIRGQVCNY